jgi:hypothetical protein
MNNPSTEHNHMIDHKKHKLAKGKTGNETNFIKNVK